jgi:hypothetical protein
VNGALFGAVGGHPILDPALDTIEPSVSYGASLGAGQSNDKVKTGPQFLDRVIEGYPEAVTIAPEIFYPRTPEERQTAYAVHHKARAWQDADGLRSALQKAEKQLAKAQEEADRWRSEYERAEADLTRLRRGTSSSGVRFGRFLQRSRR